MLDLIDIDLDDIIFYLTIMKNSVSMTLNFYLIRKQKIEAAPTD